MATPATIVRQIGLWVVLAIGLPTRLLAAQGPNVLPAGSELHNDPVVARALLLLGPDAPSVPIVVVTPHRGTVAGVGPHAEWEAQTDGHTITIARDGDAYRRARKGQAIELAALIAHEAYHIQHRGTGEGPAYAEQLRVLRVLGASPQQLRSVERAALAVASRKFPQL